MSHKILITGGAGYVGAHIALACITKGLSTIVVDSMESPSSHCSTKLFIEHPELQLYKLDVRDTAQLRSIIEKHEVQSVVHCAALKDVEESVRQPTKYWLTNVEGTLSVLQAMTGSPAKNLIYSSTAAIYASVGRKPLTELAAAGPISPYAVTKLAAEEAVRTCCGEANLSALSLRYFNPIGCDSAGILSHFLTNGRAVFPTLVRSVLSSEKVFQLNGRHPDSPDGSAVRDFIDVQDIALAHIRAIDYLAKKSECGLEVVNLGSGRETSIRQLLECFEIEFKTKLSVCEGPHRPGDIPYSLASNVKAATMLKWSANVSLIQTVRTAYRILSQE